MTSLTFYSVDLSWKSSFNSTLFHGLETVYNITFLDFQKHLQ
jgi:hypothetical protein